jgi:hypothetical protein
MGTYVKNYYEKFPLSSVGNVGSPLESESEIWRAWWKTSVQAQDQLRWRVAFALSQIFVVSEEGELDSQARAMVHYYDLLYYHGLGNFRNLLEKVSLNPAMGRYLDMLGNRKPDPATGYIPNENYAREIMQLFSIGLRRLHPDGSLVLDPSGLPLNSYLQEEVVGLAHTLTGWTNPGTGNDYVTPMVVTSANNHDFNEKLLLENTIIPAVAVTASRTVAQCNTELAISHDVIFHHPNTAPFICRQLIQRMVTANPSPGYIYRTARVFDDNGFGVRGDMAAVVKAILLDPEARNASFRNMPEFGHIKEPLLRATQLLRAFKGHSYSEQNFESAPMLGTVVTSPNENVNLTLPLPVTEFTRIGNRAIFPGEIVRLTGQTPSTDNAYYIFNGNGQALTLTASTASVATYTTDITTPTLIIPTVLYPVLENLPLTTNARVLLRNQTNPAENGIYVLTSITAPLTRWTRMDEPAEFTNARVHVAALRDAVTLAYSAKTYIQSNVVNTVGTDPVAFADSSRTTAGINSWNIGTTNGSSFGQTPLQAATVFNYYEPDYVFLGDTGNLGLFSPEFQITSETSVVNTANWFHDLTLRNDQMPNSTTTRGQGTSIDNTIKNDMKMDLAALMPVAHDPAQLVDRLGALLMPGQMTPRLRTLLMNYLGSMSERLLASGESWKYYSDAAGLGGSNVVVGNAGYDATNWKHPNFADATWSSGASPLGYSSSNSGIATVVPFGSDTASKWRTVYYRRNVTINNVASLASLTLRLKRDDGAIVYVNGVEVRRDNLAAGTVTGTSLANAAGDDGAGFFTYTIPRTMLVDGSNTVAVEVHQNTAGSSDSWFDLELHTTRSAGAAAGNLGTVDRMTRATELLSILSLCPEFVLQN